MQSSRKSIWRMCLSSPVHMKLISCVQPCLVWCAYLLLCPCVCVCVCVWSRREPALDSSQMESVRCATVDFHDNVLSWGLKPWLCHTVPSKSDISNCFSNELSNTLSSSTDGLHTAGHSTLLRIIQSETQFWRITLKFKECYSLSCWELDSS